MKQALIILGKYPHPGKVKTRLSKDLGHEITAKFYKSLLEKLFVQVKLLNDVESFFCYSDINDKELIENWLQGEVKLIDPISTNVEKNLSNAFAKLFKSFDQVVSIASDVPSINKKLIKKSFQDLNNNDVVIGPDTGGGIYLYGTKKHYPEFFQNKKTEEGIFDQTLRNIQNEKLIFIVLDKLLDIDTIEDYNIWRSSSPDIDNTHPSNYNI